MGFWVMGKKQEIDLKRDWEIDEPQQRAVREGDADLNQTPTRHCEREGR